MSTTQYSPQLRPLSVGEVLDASFKIVRQSFGTLAGCVLVVALPLNIVNTLITASTSDDAFNLDDTPAPGTDIGTGTELAGFLLTTTLTLVLMHAGRRRVLPRRVGRLPRRAPDGRRLAVVRGEPAAARDRARRSSTSSG